ncbi:transglutaminase domain-containing protein [Sediminibacterium roseum]|uniref:Transglutaminase domain-containing protein n=1 Tax=Sediminibacterium roseum TaxID=1978412 RepID=A0ABW9ZWE3_9BACT|nr:transglutaminase-like domain-containing protein [Sediminibacterium roseum]NCI50677.1 transglutaminase domain-containing protein [Sediminibacterium roseum]
MYSKYEVSIPEFFGYVTLLQGYLPFADRKTGRRNVNFSVTSRDDATSSARQSLSSAVDDMTWVIKDAPAMKEESFTTTIDNHITKIEFQLAQYRFPNRPYQDVMGSWAKVNETRMEREDFGSFKRNNGWLDDDMKLITKGAATAEEKARKIYAYVRDNFTCTAYGGTLLSDGVSLKDVFKKKSGTTGDINLLLLAMLRHESITANPVLVSSRSHGKAHPIYPLMDRFNYLVCEAKFGDTNTVYLDASHRMLGFNKLPELCYSGLAYTLGDLPAPVSLDADSLTEEEVTNLIIINDDKGFVEQ